jgi:DNA-binding transcriptional regulator YdaS (Cro superfamily)
MTLSNRDELKNAIRAALSAHMPKSTGIKKAIELAGGANALAHKLGVTHQAIYTWSHRGWVPIQRAIQIESLFGVPRENLLKPELAAILAPSKWS